MTDKIKKITDLSDTDARIFFLKEESYFTFDLPVYFTFNNLLQEISDQLKSTPLIINNIQAKNCEKVNYKLIHNKNGRYSWRSLQLIHPVIYVSLVHEITKNNNWGIIIDKLRDYKAKNVVDCLSMPSISEDDKSQKATQIIVWLQEIEQKSIALSLDYEYIFQTDIVNCYDSIYTHSISWALHTREEAKKPGNRNNFDLVGVVIDKYLQSMSNGQTNGIPQGSLLMDFIAEIVLGYVDSELSERIKINDINKEEFKILRYRDDYRIFVDNPQIGEKIIKHLSIVLAESGFKINSDKTKSSKNIINDSIKEDKLFYIHNYKYSKNIQYELLVINNYADKYPNSGSLNKLLQKLFNRIESWTSTNQNIEVIIGILMHIAYKNPITYPIAASILSKFLSLLSNDQEKINIIVKIIEKFKKIPNTEHLDLWLQRVSLNLKNDIEYLGSLCEVVKKIKNIEVMDNKKIWNSEWVKGYPELYKIIESTNIVNSEIIEKIETVIREEEVLLFGKKTQYYN
ncbi:MAG: RNA-directed DNA polymerase [Methylacidiphilales bacterium]|nr:RNA-directed DNA polymerase [Candidatus Methylacidiphilales bacterium]